LHDTSGMKITYNLYAGICNASTGSNGFHAIAIIRIQENKNGSYMILNDDHEPTKISLRNLSYHPIMLFYEKC